jgi:hypothetical protein
MKNFSDFHADPTLDGEKISIHDVVGKDIVVLAFAERASRYAKSKDGIYTIIQIELEGERRVFFTASRVLRDQLNAYRGELPFRAQIAFNKTYYTFTGATE